MARRDHVEVSNAVLTLVLKKNIFQFQELTITKLLTTAPEMMRQMLYGFMTSFKNNVKIKVNANTPLVNVHLDHASIVDAV